MNYKAIMMDLDGTTVAYHRKALPTQRVIDAISQAKKQIHVGIATSRNYIESKQILDVLNLTGPSIVSGGAQIIDAKTRMSIWEKQLDHHSVQQALAVFEKYHMPLYLNEEGKGNGIRITKDAIPDNILTLWSPGVKPELAEKIVPELTAIPTINAHMVKAWEEGTLVITVSHVEATKQHGIFEVAKLLRIETHEMIGVGDSYNDFPLLLACGLKIAMGNAAKELKDIADFVAPTVDEDGIAVVIEKFILKK